MGKQDKRSRADDDENEDRPAKKKSKKEEKGSNTMLFALVGGGVAVVLLLCVCGGIGVAGWQFGWFGGSDKKPMAKADADKGADKDKDGDKDKDKDKGNPGTPKGTGPLVTTANFTRAARDGMTIAQVEQILGPGMPIKGDDIQKAMKYPAFRAIRNLNPNGQAYQWSNSQEIYFIFFFDNGVYMGHGRNPVK